MRTGPTPPPPHRPEQGQRTDTDRLLRIDDSTALVMGIVNKVAPKDELLGEAWTLDGEKASNSPLAYAKAAVNISMETSLEQGLRFETAAIRATLASKDYQAGLAAFAEKRSPEFPSLTARRITREPSPRALPLFIAKRSSSLRISGSPMKSRNSCGGNHRSVATMEVPSARIRPGPPARHRRL